MCTDDELVAEVLRERAIESGEIEEIEDDSESEGEPELEMGVREMLVSISRLQRALLSWGDVCVRTAKMLVQVQDEVAREEIRNARQTTLEQWFGAGHASECIRKRGIRLSTYCAYSSLFVTGPCHLGHAELYKFRTYII